MQYFQRLFYISKIITTTQTLLNKRTPLPLGIYPHASKLYARSFGNDIITQDKPVSRYSGHINSRFYSTLNCNFAVHKELSCSHCFNFKNFNYIFKYLKIKRLQMVYCKRCGKEFASEEITYCPSCGKPQHQTVTQSVVVTQNKNPGTAVLIALIAGFFGFQGIGHVYIGKTGKGIGLLILGWVLVISMIFSIIGVVIPLFIILGIVIFAYWIWQAYDVNKSTKYYNEYLMQNGKSPW